MDGSCRKQFSVHVQMAASGGSECLILKVCQHRPGQPLGTQKMRFELDEHESDRALSSCHSVYSSKDHEIMGGKAFFFFFSNRKEMKSRQNFIYLFVIRI